mmetsp:Transcript_62485/g.183174  ORF Transcript_62485/g.183174 Transcript_62485/m.183174 type:complete len:315 (-) Transcript_62485:1110-2054(-)
MSTTSEAEAYSPARRNRIMAGNYWASGSPGPPLAGVLPAAGWAAGIGDGERRSDGEVAQTTKHGFGQQRRPQMWLREGCAKAPKPPPSCAVAVAPGSAMGFTVSLQRVDLVEVWVRLPGSPGPRSTGAWSVMIHPAGSALGIGSSFSDIGLKVSEPLREAAYWDILITLYWAHSSRRSCGTPSKSGVDRVSDCDWTLVFQMELLLLPLPSSLAEGLSLPSDPPQVGAVILKAPADGHVLPPGRSPAAARPVFITGRMSTTPPAAEVKLELDLSVAPFFPPDTREGSVCTRERPWLFVCRKEIATTRKLLVPTAM